MSVTVETMPAAATRVGANQTIAPTPLLRGRSRTHSP